MGVGCCTSVIITHTGEARLARPDRSDCLFLSEYCTDSCPLLGHLENTETFCHTSRIKLWCHALCNRTVQC